MSIAAEVQPLPILNALGVNDLVAVTPFYGGADALIWRVETSTARYALRVFRPNQGAVCQREMLAMATAHAAGIVVPALHGHLIWEGRPVLLLTWCPGQPLGTLLQQQVWRVWQLGTAFGRTQALIHRVTATEALAKQATDWITWEGAAPTQLQARLRALPALPSVLLHLDYHLLNVLAEREQITCVLDWSNASVGDPRADLARTYTILRVEPWLAHESPLFTALRWLLAWRWRTGYTQVNGWPHDLQLHYVWAGLIMEKTLAPRLHKPGSWWRPEHLARIQRWTTRQAQRAGLG